MLPLRFATATTACSRISATLSMPSRLVAEKKIAGITDASSPILFIGITRPYHLISPLRAVTGLLRLRHAFRIYFILMPLAGLLAFFIYAAAKISNNDY